ncbi:MAG: DUF4124 domain-containing protein [Pseudomonadota bacterium]|nr:DUF4124 domain-containing protein [Pseudomonadota bacterium]
MLKGMLLFIALLFPIVGHATIYQCKVDGQTIFSDEPCGEDAKELNHEPAPAIGGRFDTGTDAEFYKPESRQRSRANDPCPYINTTDLRRLIVQNKIKRGMKPVDVRRSWGSPSSILTGRRTQWAYHYTGGSANYVYFENGCVVDWSGYYR